jgi:uncharacterized protein YbaP (TraB family)
MLFHKNITTKLLMLLCYVVICCFSCQKPPAQTTQYKSLFWKISGNGLSKPSYLLGTIHIADDDVTKLANGSLDEMATCEVMAGELSMDIEDPALLVQMMDALFMPQDTTLKMLLSEEEYSFIKPIIMQKNPMIGMIADRMRPIFTATILAEEEHKVTKKPRQAKALDLYLQEAAKEKQIKVIGLETVEEQMLAFNAITLKEQAKMLYEGLKNPEKTEKSQGMDTLVNLYLSQDLDRLYKVTNEQMSKGANYKLLVERNKNMVDRMEVIMKKQPLFTAVGAAHLPSEVGMIALLRKKGYKVEAIKL